MKKPKTTEDTERGLRIKSVRLDLLQISSQEKFAQLLGGRVTRGAVANWEVGGAIGHRNLLAVANKAGTSVEWIMTGVGENPVHKERDEPRRVPLGHEFEDDRSGDALRYVNQNAAYEGELLNAIPDVDVRAGAGAGGYSMAQEQGQMLTGDAVRGELVLPDYMLRDFTPAKAPQVHSVEVRGDSMIPTLASGDRVLVDTTDKAIGQGGVFVFFDTRHHETNVKRLRRFGSGAALKIEIISDNPKQGDPDYVIAPEIIVIGRAVARLTRI